MDLIDLADEELLSARATVERSKAAAAKFAASLAKGEPNRSKIALTVLEDKIRELV